MFYFLLGCSEPDIGEIKEVVKGQLVDPDSVKFGSTSFNPKGDEACIEYNAKNRMGGYGGQSIAALNIVNGQWKIETMEQRASFCSNTGRYVSN